MRKGGKVHTLCPETGFEFTEPPTMTALQVKRAVQKGAPCILVQLRETSEEDSSLLPPEMQELGEEFTDVFGDLPHGLPPARNVGHKIPLEPRSIPPFRPLYRSSPLELDEAKCQIDEYLEKGWIEPSSSPYGAPILFVPKKSG